MNSKPPFSKTSMVKSIEPVHIWGLNGSHCGDDSAVRITARSPTCKACLSKFGYTVTSLQEQTAQALSERHIATPLWW